MSEIYKNWEIRKSDYAVGYYEATNLNDCDAYMIHGESIEEIKTEIDENTKLEKNQREMMRKCITIEPNRP